MRSSESCEGELRRGHGGCAVVLTQTTPLFDGMGQSVYLKTNYIQSLLTTRTSDLLVLSVNEKFP